MSASTTLQRLATRRPPVAARRALARLVAPLTGAVLLLAAAYLGVGGYMALVLTTTVRPPFTRTPEQYGLVYEPVTFTSRVDALPLEGWLIAPAAGAPARRPVVVVHGRNSDRQHEAGGRVLEIAGHLSGAGHAVLLFDLRGHGRSPGNRYSLGVREAHDLGGAIDLLARRGLARDGVSLLGFSMGAAAALLLAPHEPAIRAVAEDSGYADLFDVMDDQIPKASGLPRWFSPSVVVMARPLLGLDLRAIRPVEGATALGARGAGLLIVHGEADTLIPVRHAHRLAAAYGAGADLAVVPGAGHMGAVRADFDGYVARLVRFLAGAA